MQWSRPFRFSKVCSCQQSRRFPARLSLELLESRLAPALLPDGFSEVQMTSGLAQPSAMAVAPDGRLFVLEQAGNVRVIKDGQLLAAPFLSVETDSGVQRGLVGIAFDPAFESNGYVYVHY